MTELSDYSGPFDPEFGHEKFSKETLLKLLGAYSEYMLRIDGFWYLTVMDKLGNDQAFDFDLKMWERARPYEVGALSKLLNIRGNDVATVMKYIHVCPWMQMYDLNIDLKTSKHAVVTYLNCPTLYLLEKEGLNRERPICQELDAKVFSMTAHYFNPDIRITPLKVPPRTDYNDCCCQWEYKLKK